MYAVLLALALTNCCSADPCPVYMANCRRQSLGIETNQTRKFCEDSVVSNYLDYANGLSSTTIRTGAICGPRWLKRNTIRIRVLHG
jgi:hypothetical protein